MRQDRIPNEIYAALIFTGLLAPLLRAVPGLSAALAGRAAWAGVLPAFLVLMALGRLTAALRRRMPGEGLAGGVLRILGPRAGRAFLLLCAGWLLLLGGLILRSGGERLAAAAYPQSRPEPFLLVTAALALLIALGPLRAAARMSLVIRGILLLSLGAVFLLAVPNLQGENLRPRDGAELVRGLWGGLPLISVGGLAGLMLLLDGRREPEPPGPGRTAVQTALFCAVGGLLCLTVTGTYGPALTTRLTYPFFTMTRDISLWGLAQRVEALVIALWLFPDAVFLVLLLRAAREALGRVLGLPDPEEGAPRLLTPGRGRWLLWGEAAAMVLLSRLLAATPERLCLWLDRAAPLGTAILAYGGLALLWAVGKRRKKQ